MFCPAQKLQVPVIVGSDRYQAGLLAEKKFFSKLHLLDDGFQHRRLHRDFDIVLLPVEDQEGFLLPVGRLREPLSGLQRADAVVLPDATERQLPVKNEWRAHRIIELPAAGGKMIAFSGIGRPRQFLDSLKSENRESDKQEIAEAITFPDHHRYSQRDIDRLLALKKRTSADGFVTTEKDVINLGALSSQLSPLLIARLRIELQSPEKAVMAIIRTVEECSSQADSASGMRKS